MKYRWMDKSWFVNRSSSTMSCLWFQMELINAITHLWLHYLIKEHVVQRNLTQGHSKSTRPSQILVQPARFILVEREWIGRPDLPSMVICSMNRFQGRGNMQRKSQKTLWSWSLTFSSPPDQSPCDSAPFESRRCQPSRQWYWQGSGRCSQSLQGKGSKLVKRLMEGLPN